MSTKQPKVERGHTAGLSAAGFADVGHVKGYFVARLKRLTTMLALALALGFSVSVSGEPVDTLLLLDNAASMQASDPQFLARRAIADFVGNSPDDSRVALLIFDARVRVVAPFAELSTANRQTLITSLSQVDYQGRHSNTAAALERAIYELKRNAREDADKRIVLITASRIDTGDERRDAELSEWARDILASEAGDAGIPIFGIAFTGTADFQLVQTLSYKTGGAYFRAFNPDDVASALAKIEAAQPQETTAPPPSVPAPAGLAQAPQAAPNATRVERREDRTAPPQPDPTPNTPERTPAAEPSPPTAESAPEEPAEERNAETAPAKSSRGAQAMVTPSSDEDDTVKTHWLSLPPWLESKLNRFTVGGAVLAFAALAGAFFLLRRPRRHPRSPDTRAAQNKGSPGSPTLLFKDLSGITGQEMHDLTGNLARISRTAGDASDHVKALVIPDEVISREHAIIEYRDYGYWISDRGSVNGTFVNGERIAGDKLLKHGDRVRFHLHEFEVVMPATYGEAPTGLAKGGAGEDRTLLVDMAAERGNRSQPPSVPDHSSAKSAADAEKTELFSLLSESDEQTSKLPVRGDEQERTQARPAKSRPIK